MLSAKAAASNAQAVGVNGASSSLNLHDNLAHGTGIRRSASRVAGRYLVSRAIVNGRD
jgi:hypothetical protein